MLIAYKFGEKQKWQIREITELFNALTTFVTNNAKDQEATVVIIFYSVVDCTWIFFICTLYIVQYSILYLVCTYMYFACFLAMFYLYPFIISNDISLP